jgi:hypothetical protein
MQVLIKSSNFNYMVQSRYSFPNVSINSSVPGPLPQETGQRRRIGVAGVFDRGPELKLINSREEFAYLFGENNSSGSVFVRQAMLQGADQFAVSRVMPSLRASKGSITLTNGQNRFTPGNVALQGNRTIGLKFNMSYISSVVKPLGQYNNSSVRVSDSSDLKLPRFNGTANLDFQVIEKVIPSQVITSPDIYLELTGINLEDDLLDSGTFGTNQATQTDPLYSEVFVGDADFSDELELKIVSLVVAHDLDSIRLLKQYAKPGLVLKANNDEGNGNATLRAGLTFASYAYQLNDGRWGALLEGNAGVAQGFIAKVFTPQTANPYFVIAYNYSSPTFSQLPKYILGVKTYTFGNEDSLRNTNALGFLRIGNLGTTSKNIEVIARYNSGNSTENEIYTYIKTGIIVDFSSINTQNSFEMLVGDRFTISILKSDISIGETVTGEPDSVRAFRPGTSILNILQELTARILRDTASSSLIGEVTVNDSELPFGITFTSSFRGSEANRVKYKLERFVSGGNPTDVVFGDSTNSNYGTVFSMRGGQNRMSPATRILYDINGNPLVLIEAISPGIEGNRIRISVSANRPGQFQLTVDDEEGRKFNVPIRSESFLLSNYTIDPQTGLYPETVESNIIRAYFIPRLNNNSVAIPERMLDITPQRVAPISDSVLDVNDPLSPSHSGANFLRDLYLEGGQTPVSYSSINPSPEDIQDALLRLEQEDCITISTPGVAIGDSRYDSVISSLILQAQNSTAVNGIRTAIISAPKGVSVARATNLSSAINSDRVVIVSGWSSLVGTAGLGINNTPPDGIYAGLLSTLSPHISPASSSASNTVNGIFSVDTNNNPFILDALTKANIEVLFYDASLRAFKFLNGLNTSRDQTQKIVSVSRMNNKIIEDLTLNLAWVKSRPNDRSLQRNVRDAVDAYFRTLLREQQIFSFTPTICDASNNSPEDRAQRRLNISIAYTPVYPADYINVSLRQIVNEQISIITG